MVQYFPGKKLFVSWEPVTGPQQAQKVIAKCSSTLILFLGLAKILTVVIPPPLVDDDLRWIVLFIQVSELLH